MMTATSTVRRDIDVLVPVHSATRPIRRLVKSVLEDTVASVRVLIIAHDTPIEAIRSALGEYASDPRVEVLPFEDGIASPAGPLTYGLSCVDAPWFTKIDSDDLLSARALDSWLRTARRHRADAVIPRMVTELSRVNFPTPPRRPFRRVLDPVRDRLSYRTSTMGLLSASFIDLAEPSAGLPTAEDVLPSLRLWFGASRVVRADDDAPYIVGESAHDRVTETPLSLADQLAFIDRIAADLRLTDLAGRSMQAIVRKLVRVHLLGAVSRRPELYDDAARPAVADAVEKLGRLAPDFRAQLSRADVALLSALVSRASTADIRARAVSRRRYLRISALIPVRLSAILAADAPLRFLAASAFALHRGDRRRLTDRIAE